MKPFFTSGFFGDAEKAIRAGIDNARTKAINHNWMSAFKSGVATELGKQANPKYRMRAIREEKDNVVDAFLKSHKLTDEELKNMNTKEKLQYIRKQHKDKKLSDADITALRNDLKIGEEELNVAPDKLDKAVSTLMNDKGAFSYKRAAAAGLTTYGALNVPYRLISGGGLTYDNSGSTDIIGVPFI